MDFSSNDAVEAVEFWDRTVELIGYVDSIVSRRFAGKSEILKFYLNNNNGKRIQCVIWGKADIDSLENKIIKNAILHIDGGCARLPTKPEYNYGNSRYELQLFKKTNVTNLRNFVNEEDDGADLPVTLVSDVIHHEGERIKVFGYLKSKFVEESIGMLKSVGTYGCGSITNGVHKLEVRIASFKNVLPCEKGDAMNLTGQINTQGSRIFLRLESEDNIEILDERGLSLTETLAGFRELKRLNDGQVNRENVEDE